MRSDPNQTWYQPFRPITHTRAHKSEVKKAALTQFNVFTLKYSQLSTLKKQLLHFLKLHFYLPSDCDKCVNV